MTPPPRIAVVWRSPLPEAPLLDALAAVLPEAAVRVTRDPVADAERLRRFHPGVLVAAVDTDNPEDIGMLAVLRAVLGDCALVLVTPPGVLTVNGVAARLDAVAVVWPAAAAELAAAIERAVAGTNSRAHQALLSLTRGISDEVNNPLLAALGHLRLLEDELGGDEGKLKKVRAATGCLRRIQSTLERARGLQRASELRGVQQRVDVGGLLGEVVPGGAFGSFVVCGDRALLASALNEALTVARDLGRDRLAPQCTVVKAGGEVSVRIEVAAPRIADWQLPRTFEPYYLGRLLQGTSHGLSLFTVQQILAAHQGVATARRRADGSLVFELILPAAPDQG